jgi:CelD/BcsL family acetyltransferase involved in cellulose biosynthesis
LSVLYSAERVVAAHLGLRSDSALSCWFPAYDPTLARYSPGLSLHLKMAEGAAAAGLRRLELGKGDEDYKQSLKTGDVVVGEGWIERPSAAAVLRRAQRTPRRVAFNLISAHPTLRYTARRLLKQVGSLRRST